MTDPSQMTSPSLKEALEACIKDLQTIGDGLSDDVIEIAKAAIPVAELEGQMEGLLEEICAFPLPAYLRIKIDNLLAKVEALECNPPK